MPNTPSGLLARVRVSLVGAGLPIAWLEFDVFGFRLISET